MILCYNVYVKKIIGFFCVVLLTQTACDLQPKIVSLPDSVGDFISVRYPALLADPNVNPEIYNSAAADYGVYASPELYGTDTGDDYVIYASVDDYIIPPQDLDTDAEQVIEKTDVVDNSENTALATVDDYILVPKYSDAGAQRAQDDKPDVLSIGTPRIGTQKVTRVDLTEIVVARGDTLYSVSRKYAVPVNDLAVMNNLRAPFTLSVGQKLKVPNLTQVSVVNSEKVQVADNKKSQISSVQQQKKVVAATDKNTVAKKNDVVKNQPVKKISSDPKKKLPTITARSSSKFSWPVRGKILSSWGAKSNGLFNDGINIGATRGAVVKAAENGVVAYAGNEVKGMGNLIIIQHSGGWMTVYAHLDSLAVRRGSRVAVGQKIGTVGETGKVDSPQLHFEIRKGTKAYNPIDYLKK